MTEDDANLPAPSSGAKVSRAILQVAGGAVPFAGGLLSAAASSWSEHEQERVNRFFEQWLRMLKDELKEKEQTVIEIMARLDLQDEKVTSGWNLPNINRYSKRHSENGDVRKAKRNEPMFATF
jgi:hypothetical protein